jgi:hypothetical protein
MPLADIKAQIKVILSDVPDIGVVHDYERFSRDWNKFLALFQDTNNRINGCMFTREKCPKNQITLGEYEKAHIFVIRFFRGLNDSEGTGNIFDLHLEDVEAAFRDKDTLNDTCQTTMPQWGPMNNVDGIQLDINENRMFGNVLCHYAEMRLCAIETVQI